MMNLEYGALTGPREIAQPDVLGSYAKGAALGADLQNLADKQEEARQKKQIVSNLPALMGRIKENQSDFDAVSQVAQYAPGMIDYINQANKQEADVAEKRKAELVNNLAGAYAFISSADQRGMSKEQAWDDVIKWNQAHGIDMGELANEPYSDAAMARMKGLVLGTKALTDNNERYGNTVWVKDAQGNAFPMQLTKAGPPVPLNLPAGMSFLEPTETVNTGIESIQRGRFSGKIGATTAVGPSATALYENAPTTIAAKEAAKERGQAAGKQEAAASTQAVNASTTLSLLDEAEKIIPQATGSILGQARDITVGALGGSTKEAQNIARLRIIGAKLVQMVPRMEGPQSDADVKAYKAAAGDFDNPRTPWQEKMAALETMRTLSQKYAHLNKGSAPAKTSAKPSTGQAKFLGFE